MNLVIRIALACTLAFAATTASLAQKRGANAGRKVSTSTPRTYCEGDVIPKGYVIVGHKSSSKCGDKPQLTIKKPDEAEIVCDGSPVPEGFYIANQLFSSDCRQRSKTPSPNALSIVSNGFERSAESSTGDDAIGRAFRSRASDIQVEGEGTVIRVLPDDLDGSRHQRFIVELASGQTLLIAHNIDVAPRINGLMTGDSVRFYGEYVWNAKGGVIHWTHHDPQGRHVTGWLKHNGKTFK